MDSRLHIASLLIGQCSIVTYCPMASCPCVPCQYINVDSMSMMILLWTICKGFRSLKHNCNCCRQEQLLN